MNWEPVDTAPDNVWIITAWQGKRVHDYFFEIAKFDTELFSPPQWVIQDNCRAIRCVGYEFSGWAHLPPPPKTAELLLTQPTPTEKD